MIFLGIDLHSNCFTCCFIFPNNKKLKRSFHLNTDGLKDFFALLPLNTIAMVEASTNTFKFVELIKDRVKEVYVANTHKLKLRICNQSYREKILQTN
jgi:transposase